MELKIDRIVRSRRKTLALYVLPDSSLEVRAPTRLSQAVIQNFVDSKTEWITRQRAKMTERLAIKHKNGYANGARLWYLGQALTLEFTHAADRKIQLAGSKLLVSSRLISNMESALIVWYRAQARRIITERMHNFERQHGLNCAGLRINAARKRWGSCGTGNQLNFPYRLVMAPLEIIDYVVVHELVHTAQRNHGPAFWAHVAAILPDFRQRRKWLQVNEAQLDLTIDADPEKLKPIAPAKPRRLQKAG